MKSEAQLMAEGYIESQARFAREEEAARVGSREAIAREDAEVAAEIARDQVAAYTRLIDTLARRHDIRVEWRDQLPDGVAGSSNHQKRRIQIYRIGAIENPEAAAATGLHELGHIVAGWCLQVGDHRRDPAARGHWDCLACERLAWQAAMRLWPFSRGMYARNARRIEAATAQYGRPGECPARCRSPRGPRLVTGSTAAPRVAHETRTATTARGVTKEGDGKTMRIITTGTRVPRRSPRWPQRCEADGLGHANHGSGVHTVPCLRHAIG